MPLPLASRVSLIPKPATLVINARVQALQASGADIVNFSVGEPDFPTPRRICNAAFRAMEKGYTRYTAVQGIQPLREAIVGRLERDYRVSYVPDQVLVGNGGKQCLYNLFLAMIDPGDEVIIPSPYWLTYPPQVILAQGVPVLLKTRAEDGFQIDLDALEAACTSRTRAVLINSPSNPTGVALSDDVLRGIAALALRRDLLIVTDDLYYQLVYGGFTFRSIVSLAPGVIDRTVIVGGFSKAYAMTGWRMGYAVGPKHIISAMTGIQGQSTSNPSSISQYAALEALVGAGGDEEVAEMVAELAQRRDLMLGRLNAMQDITCVAPEGAFYTFPGVRAYYGRSTPDGRRIDGSIALAEYLIEAAGVAGVPGIEFGDDDHIRFSYACSQSQIEKGMDRMSRALARLG